MFPIIQKTSKKSTDFYHHYSDRSFENDPTRVSASIFKIEDYFKSSNNDSKTAFNVKESTTSDNGVFAAEQIPKGTVSSDVLSANLICTSLGGKHFVKMFNDGLLKTVIFKKDFSWMKMIKLSNDIHSHNTLIGLNRNGLVRIQILKDIAKNDELIGWFSEEILMLMSIPFLTPINIRGNNCYTCHVCNKSFEYPNPLKIHLATLCNRQSLDFLWIKLHYTLLKTTVVGSGTQSIVHQQQQQQQQQQTSLFSHDFHMKSTATKFDRHHHHHHQSAFKPIIPPTASQQHLHQESLLRTPPIIPIPSSSSNTTTTTTISSTDDGNQSESEMAAMNAAAQIETIVSNMGASKQGHLCIYCGKIYSRKYGLKIHIRTHTGFKPLKCKFCLRPFGDPSNLNKHVRLHLQTGNLTYRCHLCHKALARRRDLQRHIETKHCLATIEQDE